MLPENTPMVALVGVPNSGKSALFNALTGARQKVANYAGVTVERKEGFLRTPEGRTLRLLDLPGIYGLRARSEDEAVTRDVLTGARTGEGLPDAIVVVADATRLETAVRLVIELKALGLPMVLALNKCDVALFHGLELDVEKLEAQLQIPVIRTAARRCQGVAEVLAAMDALVAGKIAPSPVTALHTADEGLDTGGCDGIIDIRTLARTRAHAAALLESSGHRAPAPSQATRRIDAVLLHPFFGPLILLGLMFLVFQSVFAWASAPMDLIDAGVSALAGWVHNLLPAGLLRDLLADGIIAGVGGVLIFLPQILILYFFIILLEDTGYMARAAFLLDRLMGFVGLHGRSFIPLLSSFACAVPGIMAARVIENRRDRLIVILIAPLMTCSARIPVYTLLVSAFIPQKSVAGLFNLQGLVFFGLYMAGIVGALMVAAILRRTVLHGQQSALAMEMPAYQWPCVKDVALGLYERARVFVRRAGTVILLMSVLVWLLSSWPLPPAGYTGQAIEYSLAGRIGHFLQPLFAPLGFDWTVTASLVPTMAAREVFVSTLGTLYAVADAAGDQTSLAAALQAAWSLPVALSILAWFVFAPQCVATIATIRRETNSWGWTAAGVFGLFALAWGAAFAVYHAALALGL